MAQPHQTFSDQWYRVAETTPELSPHLDVLRQVYRGDVWYIVKNPATDQFYRFNPAAYMFLGMLSGQTTVDDAWEACNAQLGDDAPTQRECIELLGKLQLFGLLRGQLPLEVDMLKERSHDIRKRHFEQLTGKFVFMTLPLINPEPFLRRFENVGRFLFSRWGFAIWLTLMIAGLVRLLPRLDEFGSNFNGILDPGNLIWLSVIFIVLKGVHEFSHAFSCKAYGGRVTEMGIMLMLFLPIPYCNATDSWGFAEKWKRIGVAAAGMYGEFVIAAIAAIVWSATEPGVVHTIAFNTIFIASITTLLFNLNPLLRYDGYYMLSDGLEIPNLANRSYEMLKHLICKKIYGVKEMRDPHVKDRTEQSLLVTYALCSMPYRLLIVTGIIVAVTYRYPVVGIVLAVMGIIMWLFFPLGKGLTFILTSPILHQVRPRALLITGAASLAVILVFGVIPWPAHSYADGIVEPRHRVVLRASEPGFIDQIVAAPGQTVAVNQPVIFLRNDQRQSELAQAEAELNIQRLRRDLAKSQSEVDYKIAEQQLEAAQRSYNAAATHVERLTLAAPVAGQLVAPDLENLEGSFVDVGQELGRIATLDDLIIKTTVDQHRYDWLFVGRDDTPRAEIRVRGQAGRVVKATIERYNPAGKNQLIAPQLSTTAGGEVTMDPTSQDQPRTLRPQYVITLKTADSRSILTPGARVRVQFTNGSEPLLFGWSRRIYQSFLQKFPW
jgi:putative peptide zinc metalloprotease protein